MAKTYSKISQFILISLLLGHNIYSAESNILPATTFNAGYAFKDGLSKIKINGKYGFINKEGLINIPCIYEFASDFHQEFSIVRKGNKYGDRCERSTL